MATKKVLSIEAGGVWSKVCLVEAKRDMPFVYQAFYFQTPEHAVEDGYIRDKDAFASELRAELGQRGIEERNVIITVNSSRVVTREVEIPLVKDKEIDGVIQSQLKDYFPMDVSSFTISHKKVGVVETPEGKRMKLTLVAIPDNLLQNYVNFAEENGFEIESFEYIGNSAVSYLVKHTAEMAMMVQMEEQATIISIIADKQLLFQRIAPYGYGNAISTVQEHRLSGLENDADIFNYLIEHNVMREEPESEELKDTYADVAESLDYHVRMVETALEYFKNEMRYDFSGKMYLLGDGARIAGIRDLFFKEIPIPLGDFSYSTMMKIMPSAKADIERWGESGLLSVIGSPIDSFGIMPKQSHLEEDKQAKLKNSYVVLAAAAAISVVVIAAGTVRWALANSEHKRLTQQINEMGYIEDVYQENTTAKAEATPYVLFDCATRTPNEKFGDLIADLEAQLPTDIVVSSITIDQSVLTINMSSSTKMSVAQMLMNFDGITYLSGVSVPSIVEEESETGAVRWNYSVTANYAQSITYSDVEMLLGVLGTDGSTAADTGAAQ